MPDNRSHEAPDSIELVQPEWLNAWCDYARDLPPDTALDFGDRETLMIHQDGFAGGWTAATERPTTARADASEPSGLRLGLLQEQKLRAWPKDRIRPKSIATGVISLLAEIDALRGEAAQREPISHAEFSRFVQEATEQRARAERAEAALARIDGHPTPVDDHGRCWYCSGGLGHGPNGHKDDCALVAIRQLSAGKGD